MWWHLLEKSGELLRRQLDTKPSNESTRLVPEVAHMGAGRRGNRGRLLGSLIRSRRQDASLGVDGVGGSCGGRGVNSGKAVALV